MRLVKQDSVDVPGAYARSEFDLILSDADLATLQSGLPCVLVVSLPINSSMHAENSVLIYLDGQHNGPLAPDGLAVLRHENDLATGKLVPIDVVVTRLGLLALSEGHVLAVDNVLEHDLQATQDFAITVYFGDLKLGERGIAESRGPGRHHVTRNGVTVT